MYELRIEWFCERLFKAHAIAANADNLSVVFIFLPNELKNNILGRMMKMFFLIF